MNVRNHILRWWHAAVLRHVQSHLNWTTTRAEHTTCVCGAAWWVQRGGDQ